MNKEAAKSKSGKGEVTETGDIYVLPEFGFTVRAHDAVDAAKKGQDKAKKLKEKK